MIAITELFPMPTTSVLRLEKLNWRIIYSNMGGARPL